MRHVQKNIDGFRIRILSFPRLCKSNKRIRAGLFRKDAQPLAFMSKGTAFELV